MKKFTLIVLMATFMLGRLNAQQWSDVGDPGFTPSNLTSTNPQFAYVMAMYNDIPHMAYITNTGEVAVMRYSAGAWSALPTPATGSNSMFLHMAFDATGNLYLGYVGTSSTTFVKKYNGTSWSTVGGGGVIQDNLNGLAINPVTQEPYVAVYDGGGTAKASVYRFNGTSWVLVGPAQFSVNTQSLRMAFSSTGVPYLTVQINTSGTTFQVQKFDGTTWVAVGGASVGNLINIKTDIAVDATGAPYVFSANPANGNKANVLKFNGTAWVAVGQADFSAGAADHPFLKFDNSGVLHLAYQDAASANGANKATVMKFNGTSWVGVGNAGLSGAGVLYPTLAFNSSNLPFIGFRDASTTGSKGTVMKLCTSNAASVNSTLAGFACGSGTVTLSATSTGTLRWYNAATNGAYLATGTSYTTPSLTTSTTYSVAAYDVNGCSSARTAVTASVNAIPTISSSTGATRCGSGTVSLAATPTVGTIQWFTAASGGSSAGIGTPFTTPSLSTTTTYYAEANNSGCISASRTAVVATVKTLPTLGIGFGGFRCGSGSVNLSTSAFPTGATVTWFAASSGGSSLGNGDTFATPSITNSTTFYAEGNLDGCVSVTRQAIVAEVRQIPSVTSTIAANRCGPGSVSLSSTTNLSSQSRWFDASTGGTQLAVSPTFATPSLSSDTDFYVEAYLNGCASPRTAVTATIKPIPTVNVNDLSRCDAGTVTFEASSTGAISWFAAPSGGSALANGPNYTTPTLTATTSYYVEAVLNGCTTPSRTQAQAIVIATPSVTGTTSDERCGPGVLFLAATTSGSAEAHWYDANTGGSVLSTSNSFTTPSLNATTTYYVEAILSGCPSPRTAVTATINPVPTMTATDVSRCDAGTVTLQGTSTGNISWFAAATGGTAIATGSSFTTPSLSVTTPYFAEAVINSCSSPRIQVQAIVIPRPAKPVITQNNSNLSSPVLTSSATANNQWFKDGTSISGATSTTYTVTSQGEYSVQAGTGGCLSTMSDAVLYIITGMEGPGYDELKVYPNPTAEELIIQLGQFEKGVPVLIDVLDFTGRAINHTTASGGEEVAMDVRNFTAGQYIVRASQGSRKMIRKFIKSY